MNLLLVTGIFPPDRGGPASYVPRIAEALTAAGHRVEVICLSDRMEHDDTGYRFGVLRLRRRLFWLARVVLTTFTIWRAALRSDLVYVNGLGAEAAIAAFLAGRRTVHKIVGDYAWERAVGRGWFAGTLDEYQTARKSVVLRALDLIRTFPLRLASQIIVPSRYLRRIVEGWSIGDGKVRVIYNSSETGPAAGGLPLPEWRGTTLITVCRLVWWKGVDVLIRQLPLLPDTRLVIAGDGHLRAELEALARTLGAADRVLFLGDVPHREVRNYLEQADAFVLNSTYEGLPHSVLEAMVAGVPVIATDAGGTGEVVEHNVTGLLIPIGDAEALTAAIERLRREPALGPQLAAEAARQLATRFDPAAMIADTESVLLAAIDRMAPTPPVPAEVPR